MDALLLLMGQGEIIPLCACGGMEGWRGGGMEGELHTLGLKQHPKRAPTPHSVLSHHSPFSPFAPQNSHLSPPALKPFPSRIFPSLGLSHPSPLTSVTAVPLPPPCSFPIFPTTRANEKCSQAGGERKTWRWGKKTDAWFYACTLKNAELPYPKGQWKYH